MERVLARLERKLGRFAIERLTLYLIAGMAIAFVIGLFRPDLIDAIVLDPRRVPHQPWRLVSWIFFPPSTSILFILFSLSFLHFIGTSLESNWGSFKFNVYYLVGMLGTIAAAFITRQPMTNMILNESLLFAVATLAPDYEINFFISVKLKWIALLGVVLVAYQVWTGSIPLVALGFSLGNYLLFFGAHLLALVRGRRMQVRQAARRDSLRPPPVEREEPPSGKACAMCGARQDDGADIRVCSCAKCGGPRELCLEHARNH